jgi:hypothetical protein
MSTRRSIYREINGYYYNVRNAPVQALHLNTLQSRDHYSPLIFTNISMPMQSRLDMCHMLEKLRPRQLRQLVTSGATS